MINSHTTNESAWVFCFVFTIKKTRSYKLFLLSLKKEIGKNISFMLFEFYELLVY